MAHLSSFPRDLVTLFLAIFATSAAAQRVATAPGPHRFPLADASQVATIVVDSTDDYAGVVRAAHSLQSDVAKVTGTAPGLATSTKPPLAGDVLIVGTVGRSALVDRLIAGGRLDATGLSGTWEAYVRQEVDKPFPGVDRALVIAGSDKRGTIYGMYDLSSAIGVSPWTWWADVPVAHRASLFIDGTRFASGEPAVKYRGIFLNDEAPALAGMVHEKFGDFNHQFYERVFELVLRLKGNYLWPAMWGNAFNDDDKSNPVLADEYGVVMGTSHHEPMLRAQQEWKRYGSGAWDYGLNDSTLRAFWADGIRHMGTHESIVTIGMRGDGDKPMTTNGESNVSLLERVVQDQRSIIAKVTGKDASKTPQLWALYKEVQDYYDKGMRVPDDVTLLFSDDNWGNVRRLPAPGDTARAGGFGIYYHFDYVGGPRNYKWINTNPIARVWDQMHLAYTYGAKKIWIVNVGDLKPMEFPISFFLDYAWNPARWPADSLVAYTREWAAQQFGLESSSERAAAIADVITTTLKFAGRRKPELLDTATYSLTNFREAETVVAQYDSLRARARAIGASLPAAYHDAYYELVLHPVEAAANLNELYVTVAENREYALQGRAATNELAARARQLFAHDAEISRYYNTQLAGGKWDHMMDQTHIGYTYWQEPPRNTMPRVDEIQLPDRAEMGVAVVEQNRAPPARPAFGRGGGAPPPGAFPFGPRAPVLPPFDGYSQPTYHVDVYNRGTTPFEFTATAAEPWVVISPSRGTVAAETRVAVSIDWKRAPVGVERIPIRIVGPRDTTVVVQATVENHASPSRDSIAGFVEGDGYVSMAAEHFTRAVAANGISWLSVPDLGRTGSAMEAAPVTAPSQTPGGAAPRLEYAAYLFDSGTVKVHAYLSPTLNFTNARTGLRYAVSFDDQPPQVVDAQADTTQRAWERSVVDNIVMSISSHELAKPGPHVLKFWMVDPGVVVQKLVIEARPLPQSYLGPPESYHPLPATAVRTADLRQSRPR